MRGSLRPASQLPARNTGPAHTTRARESHTPGAVAFAQMGEHVNEIANVDPRHVARQCFVRGHQRIDMEATARRGAMSLPRKRT
jgi:hypothetical protein